METLKTRLRILKAVVLGRPIIAVWGTDKSSTAACVVDANDAVGVSILLTLREAYGMYGQSVFESMTTNRVKNISMEPKLVDKIKREVTK